MLTLTVPDEELFNESTGEIIQKDLAVLELEHSLVSLSKWEQIHEKPFLGKEQKTPEELLSYFYVMILTPNTPPEIVHRFSSENIQQIASYIEGKQTATWFNEATGTPNTGELITSELIYYWLTAYNIPFSVETWHLSRLFTLLRIANLKNQKPKKMSPAEMARRNRELNAERRKNLGTSG